MRLAPRVFALAALFVVALLGLVAPGVAGEAGLYVWLGVLPGLAGARLLLPRASAATRWTLGLALSPLVSTLAGWALVSNGVDLLLASRMLGMGSWMLFAGGEARSLGQPLDDEGAFPLTTLAMTAALASSALVALALLLAPALRLAGGAWVHAALALEILLRGAPPLDPRAGGAPWPYEWTFDFFLAQLSALRPLAPLGFLAVFRVAAAATLTLLALTIADVFAAGDGATRARAVAAALLGALAAALAPPAALASALPALAAAWAIFRWLAGASPRWLVVLALAIAGMRLFDAQASLVVLVIALAAGALAHLARTRGVSRAEWTRAAVAAAACVLGLAASAAQVAAHHGVAGWSAPPPDVRRALHPDARTLRLAAWLRDSTGADAIVVDAPEHDEWTVLAGRRVLARPQLDAWLDRAGRPPLELVSRDDGGSAAAALGGRLRYDRDGLRVDEAETPARR